MRIRKRIFTEYVWHRQTLNQLGYKYGRGIKWVRKQLDRHEDKDFTLHPQPVVLVADCTFWGRGYGVIVFRCPALKKNLYWKEIKSETATEYEEGKRVLEDQGWVIQGITVDGRRGIKEVFRDIPTQHCQFHQGQTVKKYLTTKPKLQAGKELRLIALGLTRLDEKTLLELLQEWYKKWYEFISEKTIDPNGKHWNFTHGRTRSAFFSLRRNLTSLYTYKKYPELNIPNTTNSLDGSFGHLKPRISVHRGMTKAKRFKVISEILQN